MHDGSLATLEAVVEHYDHGGVDRPSRSDLMKPLGLTSQEKSDLVAFMKTLSSNLSPTAVPVLPADPSPHDPRISHAQDRFCSLSSFSPACRLARSLPTR